VSRATGTRASVVSVLVEAIGLPGRHTDLRAAYPRDQRESSASPFSRMTLSQSIFPA
jgi:hypothetical protein